MVTAHWADYFVAQAGAFAALTGLVFVALSINLKEILAGPGLSGRAGEAIILLVTPVLLALAGLIPDQSQRAFGIEVLVFGLAAWIMVTFILLQARVPMRERARYEKYVRIIASGLGTILFVIAGGLLAGGVSQGHYVLAAGAAVCLISGIFDAWILLVEILR